jgi:hypothetical protein
VGYLFDFADANKDGPLFESLLADLKAERGNFFIFIGAGLSYAAAKHLRNHWQTEINMETWQRKFPLWDELVDTMSEKIALKSSLDDVSQFRKNHDNIDVAQYLKTTDLNQYNRLLRDSFFLRESELPSKPPPIHENLLKATKGRTIITSNYDELIEFYHTRIFGLRPEVACTVQQLRDLEPLSDNTKLIKMHGSIADPETIVLTREDYAVAWQKRQPMFEFIRDRLQQATCVFVGYSMRDSNFNFIYDQVRYFSGFRMGKLNYSVVSAETTPTNELTRNYWGMRGLAMVALQN